MSSVATCTHLWECEDANGPTSRARCRYCGAEQELGNHLPDLSREQMDELAKIKARLARKQKPERKERNMGKIRTSTGAARARELAETKRRYHEMVAEGRSEEEIAAMLAAALGGPPSSTTLRHWRQKARPKRTSHVVQVDVPIPDAPENIPEIMPEIMPGQAGEPVPGTTGSAARVVTDCRIWEDIMALRPPWSQKPRLARWLELVDAAYQFLVECGGEG